MVYGCEYSKTRRISVIKNKAKVSVACAVYWVVLRSIRVRKPKGTPQRDLVIVFMGALGDFLVFCGYAKLLADSGRSLTLVTKKGTGIAEAAELTNIFAETVEIENRFGKRLANIRRLSAIECDTVICLPLGRHILPDVYSLAIRANQRIMADTRQDCISSRLKKSVDRYATRMIPITETAEVLRYEQLLRGMGIESAQGTYPFIFPGSGDADGRSNALAVFPGSGKSAEKRWPVENFAKVIREMSEEKAFDRIYLLGTEADKDCCREIKDLLPDVNGVTDRSGNTSIRDVVDTLRASALCVSNDTGGAHLSISCGVPTVVICGMWQPGRFFPNPGLPDWCRCVSCDEWETGSCMRSSPDCAGHQSAGMCVLRVEKESVIEGARKLHKEITTKGEKTR